MPGFMPLVNGGPQADKAVCDRAAAQIGTRDFHAQVEQNLGNPAHADSADPDEVNVLGDGKHLDANLHCTTGADTIPHFQ